jgi:hypothetical protein
MGRGVDQVYFSAREREERIRLLDDIVRCRRETYRDSHPADDPAVSLR